MRVCVRESCCAACCALFGNNDVDVCDVRGYFLASSPVTSDDHWGEACLRLLSFAISCVFVGVCVWMCLSRVCVVVLRLFLYVFLLSVLCVLFRSVHVKYYDVVHEMPFEVSCELRSCVLMNVLFAKSSVVAPGPLEFARMIVCFISGAVL